VIVLLLVAILITLLGVWWLVPVVLGGLLIYIVGFLVVMSPVILLEFWSGWRQERAARAAKEDTNAH
jgi:hypothetical protein